MANVYFDGKQHIDKGWSERKHGADARKLRDAEARRLRKEGWEVVCKKWNFTDLARTRYYTLAAKK